MTAERAASGQGSLRSDARENCARAVAAAAGLFAAEGLRATQADVARRAGLGVATLYRRFPNKDDLIFEVYAHRLGGTERLALQAAEMPRAWDGLVFFLERTAAELAGDRGFREFILGGFTEELGWSRSEPSRRLVELLEEGDNRVATLLAGLLRRAQEDGDLRADLEVTDVQMIAAAIQAAAQLGGSEHPDLYRRMIGLVLDGLRHGRTAPTPLPERALTHPELSRLTSRTSGAG